MPHQANGLRWLVRRRIFCFSPCTDFAWWGISCIWWWWLLFAWSFLLLACGHTWPLNMKYIDYRKKTRLIILKKFTSIHCGPWLTCTAGFVHFEGLQTTRWAAFWRTTWALERLSRPWRCWHSWLKVDNNKARMGCICELQWLWRKQIWKF